MEKSKRLLTLIAIAAVLTISTVSLAMSENWFSLIYDPMELDIPDISTEEALELKEMPQWFSSEVSMEGSGYSGQVHNVSVTIYHDRPSNGIPWLADGSYSLNLKLAGTIVEQILTGSFTNLGMWDPYTTSYLWTPISPPDNYTIELNITSLSWKEMPTYTITATAGPDGSISDPGENIVLEGDSQGFTIIPDSGYAILDVLVDGISVSPVSEYLFENVQADHTIHASFALQETYMSNAVQTAYAEAPIWWHIGNADSGLRPRYDGQYTNTYLPGDTIELTHKFHITGEIPSGTRCTSYTYNVVIERVGGGDAFTAVPSTTETGDWGLGTWIDNSNTFTAPGFGEWFATVHVSDVTWTTP